MSVFTDTVKKILKPLFTFKRGDVGSERLLDERVRIENDKNEAKDERSKDVKKCKKSGSNGGIN